MNRNALVISIILAVIGLGGRAFSQDAGKPAEKTSDHTCDTLLEELASLQPKAGVPPPSSETETKAGAKLEHFFELCPGRWIEALEHSTWLTDPDLWRGRVERLSEAVEALPAERRARHLPILWALVFRLTPSDGHEEVRRQVRAATEELEAAALTSDEAWWYVVKQGWELAGEPAEVARVEAAWAEAFPCNPYAVRRVTEAWAERQGLPQNQILMNELSAEQNRELFEITDTWLERCPETYNFYTYRFVAFTELDPFPRERLDGEIARFLEGWDKVREQVRVAMMPHAHIAQFLYHEDLEIERIPALIETEIAEIARQRAGRSLEYLSEARRRQFEISQTRGDVGRWALLAEVQIRLGQADEARRALEGLAERTEALSRLGEEADPTAWRASLWRLRGELAELEDRRLDALLFYRRALGLENDEELAEKARALFLDLGGSEPAWSTLGAAREEGASSPPAGEIQETRISGSWSEADDPLEPFELADLEGRTWRLEDFAGKTLLINVWATWCAPCRLELPHLETLRKRLADRPEIEVLTFNVDYNVGLVAPYLEKEGFEFPVLLAAEYLRSLDRGVGIPQNWIVDREGIVRHRQGGFDPAGAEAWIEETLERLDETVSNP